uniref:Reverse transcriptase zinc-binding domain-containing protein n=1 Tax=Setaria viridis TaxID=4556 RepID=A0A4V6Y805_SETVI|nr:hypothetical protein SEVIR_7G015600v2 [Setaria viridis]
MEQSRTDSHDGLTSVCPLCHCTNESAVNLLVQCRYSKRIWLAMRDWTAGNFLASTNWGKLPKHQPVQLLVAWKIWNERNARIFRRGYSSVTSLIAKIKDQARMWCIAGAKNLREIIPGE